MKGDNVREILKLISRVIRLRILDKIRTCSEVGKLYKNVKTYVVVWGHYNI